ncbi:MAG: putative phosphoglycerate mutase, partial [Frankiales bacterium]|nr:putative phosphoglycerate mutase [Frankiales bacterium]
TGAVLAGQAPGLHLDDRGRAQADRLAERLAAVPLAAVVSSPLERCQETVTPLGRPVETDARFLEAGYGDWTGQTLKTLGKDPLWKVVQAHPSAVTFPGGEAMRAMAERAVAAVREWDARVGDDKIWLACSHGDVIKAVVADALGLHLDLFQRIIVDPASVTVIRYTATRPFVVRLNDTSGDLSSLVPPKKKRASRSRSSDAVVGGGSGT